MKYRVHSIIQFFILILLCQACGVSLSSHPDKTGNYTVKYAKGFTVNKNDLYTDIVIRDPWDTTKILKRYALVPKSSDTIPELPKGSILVRTPLKRVAVYTAVQCGLLEEMGVSNTICAVCEPQYITVKSVVDRVASGEIANIGEASAPDVEQIIDIAPEAIFCTPLKNVGYGNVEKIGIPIIECADYMENLPLGGTEWLRLMGLFYEKEAEADSIFEATEKRYKDAQKLVADEKVRPTVVTEMKIGSTWYVSGGNSFMAQLLADAGADYIWKDIPSTAAMPMSFEAVFEKGQHADFWLIKYYNAHNMTLTDLKKQFELNSRFDAFARHKVYGCNTALVDYYDKLLLYPDRVLTDMISIFHPDKMPGYVPYYYKKIEP